MTMPRGRSRNVIQAGALPKELRANKALPVAVRRETHRLLRHYPSVRDIEYVATFEPRVPIRGNPFDGPADPA